MLPKFLIADNSQEAAGRLFVVHAEEPRFILEGSDEDFMEDQDIHWIDEPEENELELARLVSAAVEFLEKELESQEDLFDDMDE